MDKQKIGGRGAWAGAARAALIALVSVCLAASSSGCGTLLQAGRAVWHRLLPATGTAVCTSGPGCTDGSASEPGETGSPGDTPEPEATAAGPGTVSVQPYVDIHSIHGVENPKSYIPATWQMGSSILQSEVMPMDIASVLWKAGEPGDTLSAETDINGDGQNEELYIDRKGNTLTGVYARQGGTAVNLLNLLSDEFWQAVSPIVDSAGTLPTDCVVQAFGLDLDGDGTKEILLAIGDNSAILAVSCLKYTGDPELYREIGGIIGHRLLFVTADATLYVPMGNSANGKYVEFGYNGSRLEIIGYRMD